VLAGFKYEVGFDEDVFGPQTYPLNPVPTVSAEFVVKVKVALEISEDFNPVGIVKVHLV
jgi:hypothetical protein